MPQLTVSVTSDHYEYVMGDGTPDKNKYVRGLISDDMESDTE